MNILSPELINTLSPVEKVDGIYVKMDNTFSPFRPNGISGGKIRQALELIRLNKDKIENKFNRTLILQVSVHSTMGVIYAEAARILGYKVILCVGGTNEESINKNPMMVISKSLGAEIRNVTGHGMPNAILNRTRMIGIKESYFLSNFDDNVLSSPGAILDTISTQVQNIPDNLENIIFSCGGALQFLGFLNGMIKYNKKCDNIIGCCVGPNRTDKIRTLASKLNLKLPQFRMEKIDTVYGKPQIAFHGGIQLDELYEAKSYKWMKENIKNTNNTLFWNTGKRPDIRTYISNPYLN